MLEFYVFCFVVLLFLLRTQLGGRAGRSSVLGIGVRTHRYDAFYVLFERLFEFTFWVQFGCVLVIGVSVLLMLILLTLFNFKIVWHLGRRLSRSQ